LLLRAVAGSPAQVQILYGITGEKQLPERELPWRYEGSRPVRMGNAAVGQRQLDVYGEVVNAMFEAVHGGMPTSQRGADVRRLVLEYLETIWREPVCSPRNTTLAPAACSAIFRRRSAMSV
jgi:GH15 family glucan-1,4-alpha-glucosidase